MKRLLDRWIRCMMSELRTTSSHYRNVHGSLPCKSSWGDEEYAKVRCSLDESLSDPPWPEGAKAMQSFSSKVSAFG